MGENEPNLDKQFFDIHAADEKAQAERDQEVLEWAEAKIGRMPGHAKRRREESGEEDEEEAQPRAKSPRADDKGERDRSYEEIILDEQKEQLKSIHDLTFENNFLNPLNYERYNAMIINDANEKLGRPLMPLPLPANQHTETNRGEEEEDDCDTRKETVSTTV